MTDRIDHAAEAHNYLAAATIDTYGDDDRKVAIAQVHATLALAQEQRTRNLIALFQVPDADADDFIEEGISYLDVLNKIREGLGL